MESDAQPWEGDSQITQEEAAPECFDVGDFNDLITIKPPNTSPGKKIKIEKKNTKTKLKAKVKKKVTPNFKKSILDDVCALNTLIQSCRRDPLVYSTSGQIFALKPKSKIETVYQCDINYRNKSLDQIDYLFNLAITNLYYLKKEGNISKVENICDILNEFICNAVKNQLVKTNKTIHVLKTIINIESEKIIHECVSLVFSLLKLADKYTNFKKIELALKTSKWIDLPSDYAKYTQKYISVSDGVDGP